MILHRLRVAMVRPGRERLFGRVEVDESYVGGEEPSVRAGRRSSNPVLAQIVTGRQSDCAQVDAHCC